MKIIYLSKNMSKYKGALYQRDVMEEFNRCADVKFYGPGYQDFNPSENVTKTIKRLGGADIIIVGHAWLTDTPGMDVDPYPQLSLEKSQIPKIMILNKEYTNLEPKLEWISKKNFSYGFSHHHNTGFFEKKTGIPFKFLPLAFNENLFKKSNKLTKDIDFAFCGLLKNNLKNVGQTDTRIRIMKKFFHCFGDIPIKKKLKYNKYMIFWNGIPQNNLMKYTARILNKYRFLSNEDYVKLQLRSKVFLNTLSPFGLVSTRFFENIASKALVFCEESKNVDRILPPDCFISFKSDFSDFDEKLKFAISDNRERSIIVDRAFELAYSNHTWKIRVQSMMDIIYSLK